MENKKLVYISGPGSDTPNINHVAFEDAKIKLCEQGYLVYDSSDLSFLGNKEIVTMKIFALVRCDYITLLPGWERSRISCIEKQVADYLGIVEIKY